MKFGYRPDGVLERDLREKPRRQARDLEEEKPQRYLGLVPVLLREEDGACAIDLFARCRGGPPPRKIRAGGPPRRKIRAGTFAEVIRSRGREAVTENKEEPRRGLARPDALLAPAREGVRRRAAMRLGRRFDDERPRQDLYARRRVAAAPRGNDVARKRVAAALRVLPHNIARPWL